MINIKWIWLAFLFFSYPVIPSLTSTAPINHSLIYCSSTANHNRIKIRPLSLLALSLSISPSHNCSNKTLNWHLIVSFVTSLHIYLCWNCFAYPLCRLIESIASLRVGALIQIQKNNKIITLEWPRELWIDYGHQSSRFHLVPFWRKNGINN